MRLWPLLALLFGCGQVWAAVDSATLSANLAEHSPACTRFEQTRWLADLEAQLDSTGYFKRSPSGLVWQTLTPVDSRLVLSADNAQMPLAYQVMLPVLNGLLNGDWAALQAHFALELSGQLPDWHAVLEPTDAAIAERLVQLQVSGGEQVEQLRVSFVSGDWLTLQLEAIDCAALPVASGTP